MLNYRRYRNENDYKIMREIVQHNCKAEGHLYPQIHIGNLDFERYAMGEEPLDTTWIISNEQQDIGFIIIEDENESFFYITLLCEYKYVIGEVLDFIEEYHFNNKDSIITEANTKNEVLNKELKRRGYVRTSNFRYNGMCDLSKIDSFIEVPDGYKIRQTEMEDVVRRVELFGLATGGVETTIERYKEMMQSLSYPDALDLVVETKQKDVIAYSTLWDDPVSKIGILEPVACTEEHRRKGIMKSTLLYGMNLLKDRGTKLMYVGTGGKNKASQALYKSVGFLECGVNYEWKKTSFEI